MADIVTKILDDILLEQLAPLGFERLGRRLSAPLADEWLGATWYSRVSRGGTWVFPYIGITHLPTERLLARIEGSCPPDRTDGIATLQIALGYLRDGTAKMWPLQSEGDAHASAIAIAQRVRDAGMSWMKERTSLRRICQELEDGQGIPPRSDKLLPVVLFEQDEHLGAHSVLAQKVRALGTRTDAAAEDYRAFASAMTSMLDVAT